MKMTWHFPPTVAAGMGLPPTPDNRYTLSSAEFAGRLTQATGQAFEEDLAETERQYHVMRLATVAAAAVMRREQAAQIVMDSGGFQVFEIVELIDQATGLAWLKALFTMYIEERFQDPAAIRNKDFSAWARVLTDDEIVAIAAMEIRPRAESEGDDQQPVSWLYMDRAAQIYLALQQPLDLPEAAHPVVQDEEIPMTVPEPELAGAVPGQQFTLPLAADALPVANQADGGPYGNQNDV